MPRPFARRATSDTVEAPSPQVAKAMRAAATSGQSYAAGVRRVAAQRNADELVVGAMTKAMAAIPPATRSGKPINVAQIMAQTAKNLAPSIGKTPDEIEQALLAAGMQSTDSFGPGRPINPWSGYDSQPRQYDYTVGRNISARPRADRLPFETLASVVESYDVAQICIRHILSDVLSMPIQFSAADGVNDDVADEVEAAKAFWRKPDGKRRFRRWLAMWMQDILRFDAGTLYKQRTVGGDLCALKVVSGKTIAPLVDFDGDIPGVDPATGEAAPAYVQFINGLAWGWHVDDDLIYEPFTPFPESVYGLAPVEAVLLNANTDVRFQWHFLQYFTDGSVPEGFMEAPPDLSNPQQVEEWQDVWDDTMLGDQAKRRQIRWVPAGSKYAPTKDTAFDEKFPEYLMRRTVAAFNLVPHDLGFTADVNRATGDTQADVQFRISTLPRTGYLEEIMDEITQDELHLRVKCRFDTGREKEDRLQEAQAWDIWIKNGTASNDEARQEILGLPVNPEEITPRFVFSPRAGVIPLKSIIEIAGDVDPETGAPVAGSITIPGVGFVPPAGVLQQPDDANGKSAVEAAAEAAAEAAVGASTDTEPSAGADRSTDQSGSGRTAMAKGELDDVTHAGLCVRAADTGRVLMIQRCLDDTDPASGTWEWPGGCLEGDEDPIDAARREWTEETGMVCPSGEPIGTWGTGCYQGFLVEVDSEADLAINPEQRACVNPDDPDGDLTETVAWWDPNQAQGMPGLRPEVVADPWDLICKAATAGISTATGIEGVDDAGTTTTIPGDDVDEIVERALADLDDDMAKAMLGWRTNSKRRIRQGKTPRLFDDLPADVTGPVWADLAKATTVDDVDRAFIKAGGNPKVTARPGPGGHREADIVAAYIPELGGALKDGWDVDELAGYVDTMAKAVSAEELAVITAWLEDRHVDRATVLKVVQDLQADSYLAGVADAAEALAVAGIAVSTETEALAIMVNWDNWQPGNPGLAAQLADQGGAMWADLLDRADTIVQGVSDTQMQRIAYAIAEAIDSGATSDDLAGRLAELLDDPSQAERVAITEVNRAMTAGSIDSYIANGIGQWELVTAEGACPECEAIEAGNPHDADDDGDLPPVHPSCRCAVSPVVPDSLGDMSTEE